MPTRAKILEFENRRAQKLKRCIFCHSSEKIQLFRKQTVCSDCLNSIQNLYQNGHFQNKDFCAN